MFDCYRLYKEFINSDRSWTASRRGCHPKVKCLLDQSDLQDEVKAWVREHLAGTKRSGKQGKRAPLTVPRFHTYLNDELLPRLRKEGHLGDGVACDGRPAVVSAKKKRDPSKVSKATATRYLHKLGFFVARQKSGVF